MSKSHTPGRNCENQQESFLVASALLALSAFAKVKAVSVASIIFVALQK